MPRLKIRHESTYDYAEPVCFGPWRLLMRPLDTHATRLIEASLETPPGEIKWSYDAYGNCVCHLTPSAPAARGSPAEPVTVSFVQQVLNDAGRQAWAGQFFSYCWAFLCPSLFYSPCSGIDVEAGGHGHNH